MTNTITGKITLVGASVFAFIATALLIGNALVPLQTHADTATSTEPVISSITALPTDTSATVTWTTDEASNSQVGFGTTTAYNTFSNLDTNDVTNHSVQITGLEPGTMYHYQVLSQDASSSLASSTDQTFMTTGTASSTATSTPALPVISAIVVNPIDTSATVTWTTDQAAMSQVAFGTSANYSASSTLDNTLVTNHSVTLMNLTPDTTYHFQVLSGASGGLSTSTDEMFMTLMTPTPTTTPTTTPDITGLQGEITNLQNRVTTLEQEIAALLAGNGNGGGSPPPPDNNTPAMIDQNGQSFSAGGTIDFGGHNFGHEESVAVMLSGSTVATAHADGGGNFSTGSLTLPTAPGTYTYNFVGQQSGVSANATITTH